ncbi:hypothetical protein M426DRAFT_63307 [Hypoxylon sp. CI-4A]|nr:hypothetical protein M426DRAFT_63307 [Hypoxylon sp. CI-4A]
MKKKLEYFIRGFLENRESDNSLDPIKGKGHGFHVLLHGKPGTGKTLTVELLCEQQGLPLYALTCGELGCGEDIFEERLRTAFLRATNWGAVLFIEEADILVRKREHGIQHCTIVSSFLSMLDYSQAIVFMATNRVPIIDPAFSSRVHIPLKIPDIDFITQKEIWNDGIDSLQNVSAHDKQSLKVWVEHRLQLTGNGKYTTMNGRQIRNCLSAAVALARGDGNRKKDSKLIFS